MTEADYSKLLLLIGNINNAAMLIPVVVAIWHWRILNFPIKIFFWYRILVIGFNLLEQVLIYWAKSYQEVSVPLLNKWDIHDTNFLAILYQVNAIFMIGWFYYLLWASVSYGVWIRRISWMLVAAMIINYFFIEGFRTFGVFNPNATAIFSFWVAALYLFKIFTSQLNLPLAKNPYFWLTAGVMIPNLLAFFLFIIGEKAFEQDYGLFVLMSCIKNGFLILSQIFFAIGFWNARYARFITGKVDISFS